jgi:hypothetical protein
MKEGHRSSSGNMAVAGALLIHSSYVAVDS